MSESEGVWWWEECRRKAPCVCVHEAVLDGPFQQSLEETDKWARGHEVGEVSWSDAAVRWSCWLQHKCLWLT